MTDSKIEEKPSDVRSVVRQHYGEAAAKFTPKGNSSCCGASNSADMTASKLYPAEEIETLPEDVTGLSMGCGDPITLAALKPGQTVLDLGSGGGIDCFMAAKKVGETGHVIGVDMTAEMLEKARANQAKMGFTNVDFRLGEIEHLPVADNTVDVIISNCVVNLSPDKPQVFREAYRVLKPGGKLALSDIVTDGPLPKAVQDSLIAWAGCMSGALELNEYIAELKAAGFSNIEITPQYFDQETIDEAVKEVASDSCCGSGRKLVINDGAQTQVIELDEADLGDRDLREIIFSAQIKAYK